MTGVVRDNEPLIRLTVHGTRGRKRKVEAVIDTGFNGYLTLPPDVIAELGLPWQTTADAILADGSICSFEIYEAAMSWDRRVRSIIVSESDSTPLVGMAMLHGFELNMLVQARGKITIKRLTGGQASGGHRR